MRFFKSNPEIVSCLSGDLIHFTIHFKICYWILTTSGKPRVDTWMPFCYGVLWNMFANIAEDLHRPVLETCPVVISCVGVWHEKTTTLKCCNGFTFSFCLFVWVWSRHAQEQYEKLQVNAEATRFAWRLCTLSKCEGSGHRFKERVKSVCWRCTEVPGNEKSTGNDVIIPFRSNALQTLTSTHKAAQPLQQQQETPAVWGFWCSSCCSLVWSE